MKICLVTHQHPPNVSTGLGRYSMNLTEMLEKEGHEVTVITHDKRGGEKYEKRGNVEIYRLTIPKSFVADKFLPNLLDERILFESKLKKFFKKRDLSKYNLLHILDMRDSLFLNKRIASQIPVIITANDYYPFETSWNIFKFPYFCLDLPLRYLNYMYYKLFLPRHMKKADIIICNSHYTAKSIEKNTTIPKDKLKVIYKGINVKQFSSKDKLDENKYKSHMILSVGSNMERKGVEYILKALSIIKKKYPDTKLVMIGRKSWFFKKQMEKIVKKHNLYGNINEEWYIHEKDIPKYLKNANVFVMPSIIEALGQVYMEAMCMKTPVIGTNVGGVPEVISKECGYLVEPKNSKEIAEKIIEIFDEPQKAKELGENGRKIVEKRFSMNKMVDETIKVYEEIIKDKNKKKNKVD